MNERFTDQELIDSGKLEIAPEGHLRTPRHLLSIKIEQLETKIHDQWTLAGKAVDDLTKERNQLQAQLQAQLKAVREYVIDQGSQPRATDRRELLAEKIRDGVLEIVQEAGNSSEKQNLGSRNTIGGMLKDNDTGEVSEPTTTHISDFPEDLK
jgi:hypothetical protein